MTLDPPDPRIAAADVPRTHAAVVSRMIARSPERRYPTVRFALRDLERLAAGEEPLLEASSWWDTECAERLSQMSRRPSSEDAYEILSDLLLEFLSMVRFAEATIPLDAPAF